MPVFTMALLALMGFGAIRIVLTTAVILEHSVHAHGETQRRTSYDNSNGHRCNLRRWQFP